MDRFTNCPENVDKNTWAQLCKLRRDKIAVEEALKLLGIELTIISHLQLVTQKYIYEYMHIAVRKRSFVCSFVTCNVNVM
jgi:hypothetical protein